MILTDTHLCEPALKWELEYLKQHMGGEKCMVFTSKSHKFKYYDDAKVKEYEPNFIPPTKKVYMPFSDFVKKLQDWEPGDDR